MTGAKKATSAGSSPRVWGIRVNRQSRASYFAVHPHVCGEYDLDAFSFRDYGRFIPTCVGNTDENPIKNTVGTGSSPRVWGILSWRLLSMPVIPVHPHVCGEYFR